MLSPGLRTSWKKKRSTRRNPAISVASTTRLMALIVVAQYATGERLARNVGAIVGSRACRSSIPRWRRRCRRSRRGEGRHEASIWSGLGAGAVRLVQPEHDPVDGVEHEGTNVFHKLMMRMMVAAKGKPIAQSVRKGLHTLEAEH